MAETIAAPLLEMCGITKEFPGVRALDNVSFDIVPGEIHALVGENGAGKSTLIKILGGIYPHREFSGELRMRGMPVQFHGIRDAGQAGIAVIHQELMLVKQMTVAENLFLGDEHARFGMVSGVRMTAEARRLMEQLELDIDVRAEVNDIGVGKQQLVEIARALRKNATILVLDEPTSALAEQEVERVFRILRELRARGVTIVYISHKLEEVFALADRITVLRDGKSVDTRPTTAWTRDDLVRAMVGRELTEMFPTIPSRAAAPALEVEGLTLEDFGIKGRMILNDVSFTLRHGEIVGLAGLMGAGRTELLSTLFGTPPGIVRGGIVLVEGKPVSISSPADAIRHTIALVPEDRKNLGLVLELPVMENLSLVHLSSFSRGGFIDAVSEFKSCSDLSSRLQLRSSALRSAAGVLSGGNQQKIVLGKWLMHNPQIFFLDEPTRGIDIGAKVEIYRLMNELKARGAGIIMASSELPEVIGMSDRILVLRRGRINGEFLREEATPEKIMECAA